MYWVAYRVDPALLAGPSRSRNWATHPDLSASDTLTPGEYDDASVTLGVDRGHQAPLASVKGSSDWRQANCLSNITPQFTKLNQGEWKELEEAVRDLARTHPTSQVYVTAFLAKMGEKYRVNLNTRRGVIGDVLPHDGSCPLSAR